MDKFQDRLKKVIGEISSLRPRVIRTIDALRNQDAQENAHVNESNVYTSPTYLRLLAFSHGMIKIRLMIEENFLIINTFGVLATTRYVLELLIWYRLLKKDVQTYACYYASLLIKEQLEHNTAHLKKVKDEIEFFKDLATREEGESNEALTFQAQRDGASLISHSVRKSLDMIMGEIDRSARREFSLYSEEAKTNGVGFQAYLMEEQVVPQLERLIDQIEKLRTTAKEQMPNKWPTEKWRWDKQANNAGLSKQFDFVYGYTSKLLHAKPISFSTNQKNLEAHEMVMCLDFVYVAILEAIEISEQLVGLEVG